MEDRNVKGRNVMNRSRRGLMVALGGQVGLANVRSAAAATSARLINQQADQALHSLYSTQPKARLLAQKAKAILIFPRIVKAGLIVGGQGGDGVLRAGGKSLGYYNIAAASFGL